MLALVEADAMVFWDQEIWRQLLLVLKVLDGGDAVIHSLAASALFGESFSSI